MKKIKRKIFGIPIALFIVGILLIGGVSAGLLTLYGKIIQPVNVEQAVTLSGDDCEGNECIEDIPGTTQYGDPLYSEVYTMTNLAGTQRNVELVTTYDPLIDKENDEITTEYYKIGKLKLTKKNTQSWQPIEDSEIEITYTLVRDTFEFSGVPDGYTLIYYKDKVVGLEGRLDNPQPAIIVTSDIGSLPQSDDANIDELADYCAEPDFYEHCKGAKLWVVLTEDINDGTLAWGNWDEFYFETDLITYTEATWKTNGANLTLEGGESLSFVVVNKFNTDGFDGTITTKVNPTE